MVSTTHDTVEQHIDGQMDGMCIICRDSRKSQQNG